MINPIEEEYRFKATLVFWKFYELGLYFNLPDIREFLETRDLAESVYVLVTKELLAGDEKALANKLWNLEKINDGYRKILEFWENKKTNSRKGKNNREIRSRYLEILAVDPFLPKELLPSDWCRQEVERLIKKTSF